MTEEQATKAIDDRLAELRDAPDDGWHPDGAAKPATDDACAVARQKAIEAWRYSSSRDVPPIFARRNGGVIVVLGAGQCVIDPNGTSATTAYEETDELFECFWSNCKYEVHEHGPITQAETFIGDEYRCCLGCGHGVDPRPVFEELRFVWVCAMVQIRDHEPNGDGSAPPTSRRSSCGRSTRSGARSTLARRRSTCSPTRMRSVCVMRGS